MEAGASREEFPAIPKSRNTISQNIVMEKLQRTEEYRKAFQRLS